MKQTTKTYTDANGAAEMAGLSREHFIRKYVKTGLLRPLILRSSSALKHAKYFFVVREIERLLKERIRDGQRDGDAL